MYFAIFCLSGQHFLQKTIYHLEASHLNIIGTTYTEDFLCKGKDLQPYLWIFLALFVLDIFSLLETKLLFLMVEICFICLPIWCQCIQLTEFYLLPCLSPWTRVTDSCKIASLGGSWPIYSFRTKAQRYSVPSNIFGNWTYWYAFI